MRKTACIYFYTQKDSVSATHQKVLLHTDFGSQAMTGALEAERREGTLKYATVSLVLADALSSPLRENSQTHAWEDEAVALEVYPGYPRLHAAEEASLDVCRVCQCSEADKTGEAALKVLGISAPSHQNVHALTPHVTMVGSFVEKEKISSSADCMTINAYVGHVDRLMDLGCACKNDLALAHYACALRWFVSRGSVICEICGVPALNVSLVDRNKVLCALKGKNALQHQSHVVSGETIVANALLNTSEELVQVAAWFAPVCNTTNPSRSFSEQVIDVPDEGFTSTSPATKWAVEAAGILIATGLLTVTITWLLSPQVDKGVARRGLNVLLGGLCALSIVVFLRFGVLPRIKYGPARYWAILVVFWFLVFGVWASTTRNAHSHM